MNRYYLLLLPGILLLLLPFVKIAIDGHKAKARRRMAIAEKERREAERREALRKANEEREAQKAAEAAEKAETATAPKRGPGRPRKNPAPAADSDAPKRKPGRPRKNPQPEQRPETIPAEVAVSEQPKREPEPTPAAPADPAPVKPVAYVGNNVFAGETVAFTGTLPGMTRREAIEAVKKNGGRAFDNMAAGTTILVVGDRPGKRKLDNADRWIGSCRKISAEQFSVMLKSPLTLTPEQFADYVNAIYAA